MSNAFALIEGLIVVAILFIITAIVGGTLCEMKRNAAPATIIERTHAASSTSTAVGSNGKVAVVCTPERWELVVQNDEGKVYAVEVSPEAWAAAKPGTRINDPQVEK